GGGGGGGCFRAGARVLPIKPNNGAGNMGFNWVGGTTKNKSTKNKKNTIAKQTKFIQIIKNSSKHLKNPNQTMKNQMLVHR
ncbi:hypothetical protein, partial [Enterococcus faecium]|uniref:hypothetical protein n=1 Tax=Enterococcus faecium TaxID=1352 RepID=UPI003CC6A2DA